MRRFASLALTAVAEATKSLIFSSSYLPIFCPTVSLSNRPPDRHGALSLLLIATGRPPEGLPPMPSSALPSPILSRITVGGAFLLAILAARASGQEPHELAEANRRCLECHGREHITELDPLERYSMTAPRAGEAPPSEEELLALPATRPELLVDIQPSIRRHLDSFGHMIISGLLAEKAPSVAILYCKELVMEPEFSEEQDGWRSYLLEVRE